MPSSLPNTPLHDGSTLRSGPGGVPGSGSGHGVPTNPSRQLGPYVLQRELGRGSYGAVFLARHTPSGGEVALKVLLGTPDAETVNRFKREAAITARLQAPAIVRTLDVGFDGQHHYYAMDYVQGPTLKDRLRQGPLPPTEAAELVAKLAEAAAEAHQWGVIHRDLKPANVILSEPEGEPRITDFGLARDYAQERLTHTGEVMGTPAYMAPEQFRGDRGLDHRVDIYALGILLYKLVTGALPYSAKNLPELNKLVEAGQAVPPRKLNPEVSPELEAACLRAMDPDPNQRFVTASALASALRSVSGEKRARRSARSAPTPEPAARTPVLGWVGWGVAALAVCALAWQVLHAAPQAEPLHEEAGLTAAEELERVLREIAHQREEGAPPQTRVRQLNRALELSQAAGERDELEAELAHVRKLQLQIDEAHALVEELKRNGEERADPRAVADRADALDALLSELPPEVHYPARDALAAYRGRAKVYALFEQLPSLQNAQFRTAFAIFAVCHEWKALGAKTEREGLEELLRRLPNTTHHPAWPMLRGIVLFRLDRQGEARTTWATLDPKNPRSWRCVHHYQERGLRDVEAEAIAAELNKPR